MIFSSMTLLLTRMSDVVSSPEWSKLVDAIVRADYTIDCLQREVDDVSILLYREYLFSYASFRPIVSSCLLLHRYTRRCGRNRKLRESKLSENYRR